MAGALSFATEQLRAWHTDPIMGEGRHHHCWSISVFWRSAPFRDARVIKVALRGLVAAWQDKDLPEALWASEELAAFILRTIPADIVGVKIERPEFGGCVMGETA